MAVLGRPQPIIVKVAPPHVATAPELRLDPDRILFEARSLRVLGTGGDLNYICSEAVRPPACLDFDVEAHALVMEDVGDLPDLGEALRRRGWSHLGSCVRPLHRRLACNKPERRTACPKV
jgi:hypothetical protein